MRLLPRSIGSATVDVLQHLVRVDEQHIKAQAARCMGQGLGQPTLANPGRAADLRVALAAGVVATGKL